MVLFGELDEEVRTENLFYVLTEIGDNAPILPPTRSRKQKENDPTIERTKRLLSSPECWPAHFPPNFSVSRAAKPPAQGVKGFLTLLLITTESSYPEAANQKQVHGRADHAHGDVNIAWSTTSNTQSRPLSPRKALNKPFYHRTIRFRPEFFRQDSGRCRVRNAEKCGPQKLRLGLDMSVKPSLSPR
eukprot:5006845-Pyramimonas_sp.AAC.1